MFRLCRHSARPAAGAGAARSNGAAIRIAGASVRCAPLLLPVPIWLQVCQWLALQPIFSRTSAHTRAAVIRVYSFFQPIYTYAALLHRRPQRRLCAIVAGGGHARIAAAAAFRCGRSRRPRVRPGAVRRLGITAGCARHRRGDHLAGFGRAGMGGGRPGRLPEPRPAKGGQNASCIMAEWGWLVVPAVLTIPVRKPCLFS